MLDRSLERLTGFSRSEFGREAHDRDHSRIALHGRHGLFPCLVEACDVSPFPTRQPQRVPPLWTGMEQLQDIAEVTHRQEPNSIGCGLLARSIGAAQSAPRHEFQLASSIVTS